ncbi:MAG: PH domain-containing protein [Aigarchaeota archaeon]|nr:PH domain-containing protein [Aigarchaeota archaeon]
MSVINKPEVSKVVAWPYLGLALFIAALIMFFTYTGFFTSMGSLGILAAAVTVFVEAVMLIIIASIYRTRYILTEEELVVKATRLIGGEKRIPLRAIRSVERTLIPFGLRLFGASFYGGHYYFPGLGRAFMTITNFSDGILLKTDQGNYVITPGNPENFKKTVESNTKALIDREKKVDESS